VKTENVAEAITILCSAMFGECAIFPSEYWAASFPVEVALYGLLEAENKRQRTPGMNPRQIMNFANTVMERRYREQHTKHA